MGRPLDGFLGKNIVEILPREEDKDQVIGLTTTPKQHQGKFPNNEKGNGTRGVGPRNHNMIQPG